MSARMLVVLTCDRCGEEDEFEYRTIEAARQRAEDWLNDGDKDYCTECRPDWGPPVLPNPFVAMAPVPKKKLNTRCHKPTQEGPCRASVPCAIHPWGA